MQRQSTARNLQFGLLALEEQMIGAEDLARALDAWLEDRSKPLSAILADQKSITDTQHARIAALLDAHADDSVNGGEGLRDGQDDATTVESLDIGLLASVRQALGRLGDVEVSTDFEQLLDSLAPRAGGSGDAAVNPPVVSDDFDQRFEILGEHARGGLGEVLLVRDKEFNRRVALKQIRSRWSRNADCRDRFLQEAEVTGRLEHPGVVPVYALGKRADGCLYYTMRFIRGESMEQAIKRFYERTPTVRNAGERSVEFRQLLARFVVVCNTIDYAHSRGIVHRDIKPANIMLGKYGETLVVDWGLAKQVEVGENWLDSTDSLITPSSGSGSSPTVQGSAVGTPHYMSPEQALGQVNEMGPATDVFCLGATLYHLLTGQPPQNDNSSLSKLLERVERGDFARPSEIRPDTPKPLEAICLKAMARHAAARYATAGDLASDVERWLADQPVTVYREPATTRFARTLRNHPALTAAAAVAFLLLCLTAVAANSFYQAAQRRDALHRAELREQELRLRLEREQELRLRLEREQETSQRLAEKLRAVD